MDKLYSIIVPIYGVEEFLAVCIDSLVKQSYSNIEIILVDDGSPDKCPCICDEYAKKDKRIKVVHKENGGLVSARKAGASEATGDYICCVDGDDYIGTEYINSINRIVEKFNPDIICLSICVVKEKQNQVNNDKAISGYYDEDRIRTDIFPWLIQSPRGHYFSANISGKAFRKEIYTDAQMRVDCRIKMGEDAACSMLCMRNANSLYILAEPLYFYRYNVSSMSKSRKPMSWDSAQYLSEHMIRELATVNADFKEQVYRFICHHFFNVASSQFRRVDSYKTIKNEIIQKMEIPVFYMGIRRAVFRPFSKFKIVEICLKRKLIIILYLYNKIKLLRQ